jgi:integrase
VRSTSPAPSWSAGRSRGRGNASSASTPAVEALRAHRKRQAAERLAWGEAYHDEDLVFAREDGSMERPDRVSRHFKDLARAAGLPPIKLHGGRHTAASLALEAGVAIKFKTVSDQLGHATTGITADLYTHVSKVVRDDAAERVAALVPLRRGGDVHGRAHEVPTDDQEAGNAAAE